MFRVRTLFIAALLMTVALPARLALAEAAKVEVSGAKDTTVEVSVTLTGGKNTGAFQFEIQFDEAAVQVTEVGMAAYIGSTGRNVMPMGPSPVKGGIKYGGFSLGSAIPGPDGDGVIAVVTFRFLRDGGTSISLNPTGSMATDIFGKALDAKLGLATDIVVSRPTTKVARNYLLAPNQLLASAKSDGKSESAKAIADRLIKSASATGEKRALPRYVVLSSSLLAIDLPQSMTQFEKLLKTKERSISPLLGLWTLDRAFMADLAASLKSIGLKAEAVAEIMKSTESGQQVAAVYGLAFPHVDMVPEIVDSEYQRIHREILPRPCLITDLRATGRIMIITDPTTLLDVEATVLHTLPAGDPKRWSVIAEQAESAETPESSSAIIEDASGYAHTLTTGKPLPTGLSLKSDKTASTFSIASDKGGEPIVLPKKPLKF